MIYLAIAFGVGLFLIGYGCGLADRDQRVSCRMSYLKTRAAIADYRLAAARMANRRLAMKAALATSPLRNANS